MTGADDRAAAIEQKLTEAERAHGRYEAEQLGGVYDAEWAGWYAAHVVDNGIGDVIGRDIGADELAAFLSAGFADYESADPRPAEPWSAYLARRMATEL